jgi:hypothetical protein
MRLAPKPGKEKILESFEEDTQVFIVRFWRESRELEGAHPIWRGSVEHMPSGQRIYVKNFKEVERVMSSFVPREELNEKISGWRNKLKSGLVKKEKT